jgi:hypothetical protein
MHVRLQQIVRDYGAGLAGGVLLGGAAYAFGEVVLRRLAHGLWLTAVMSGLSIALLSFGVVVGAGEPIYRLAVRDGVALPGDARKRIWKGAFLGAPCVIALLSVAEMDWAGILSAGHPVLLLRVLLLLVGVLALVLTLPVRLLVYDAGVPAELVMVLAIPVGAVLVRHYSGLGAPELQRPGAAAKD